MCVFFLSLAGLVRYGDFFWVVICIGYLILSYFALDGYLKEVVDVKTKSYEKRCTNCVYCKLYNHIHIKTKKDKDLMRCELLTQRQQSGDYLLENSVGAYGTYAYIQSEIPCKYFESKVK
jgi:predicted nucleic-acid-binding Zn-ribbon protein